MSYINYLEWFSWTIQVFLMFVSIGVLGLILVLLHGSFRSQAWLRNSPKVSAVARRFERIRSVTGNFIPYFLLKSPVSYLIYANILLGLYAGNVPLWQSYVFVLIIAIISVNMIQSTSRSIVEKLK